MTRPATSCGNAQNVANNIRGAEAECAGACRPAARLGPRGVRRAHVRTADQRSRSRACISAGGVGLLVVVPEQVEDAVDHQPEQLVIEIVVPLRGLARRHADRDHDVAEQAAAVLGVGALDERERQHVRRPLAPPATRD